MTSGPRVLLLTKNDFRHERDGGAQRVAAIVRALESDGCRVEFVAVRPLVTSLPVTHWRALVRDVILAMLVLVGVLGTRSVSTLKWYNPRACLAAGRIVRIWRPDVVVIEYSQLEPYARVAGGARVMDLHNIESELIANYAASAGGRLRRAVATYEARAMRRVEARLPRQMDAIALVSDVDRGWLSRFAGRAVLVDAPNGVRSECFAAQARTVETVVFVGHLGWRPNVDAARWLVEHVWPEVRRLLPGARLQLIGRSPAQEVRALASDDVEVIADVPSTIPYVSAARVATAPLLAAGGTRLKILEALATGTPVVSTSLGALGLAGIAAPALTLADDPAAFALAIAARWNHPIDRTAVRATVDDYRWDRTLAQFTAQVRRAAQGGVRATVRP